MVKAGTASRSVDRLLVGYLAGVTLGASLIAIAVLDDGRPGGDLLSYWELWRMVLAGVDPFAPGSYCAWLTGVGGPVVCEGTPALWPAGLWLAPLGAVPFPALWFAFTFGGVAAASCGMYRVLRRSGSSSLITGAVVGLALFVAYPGAASIASGQWGHWMLAAWVWSWPWAVAFVKPQIAGGLLWVSWWRGTRRIRLVLVVTGVVALAITAPLWWEWAQGARSSTWIEGSASAWRAVGPLAVLVAGAVALRWRRSWLVAPVAWQAAAPYGQSYDMVWLLGPLIASVPSRWAAPAATAFVIGAQALIGVARSSVRVMRGGNRADEGIVSLLVWCTLAVVLMRTCRVGPFAAPFMNGERDEPAST